jgi:hypothetical protein
MRKVHLAQLLPQDWKWINSIIVGCFLLRVAVQIKMLDVKLN